MPTPMPGSPNDELYVAPTTLGDLATNFRNVRPGFHDIVHDELERLGRYLVPEVRRRTPVASGRLARSTHFQILRSRDAFGETVYDLQVLQDAEARPQGRRSSRRRYFYWYTVHHGLRPAGRLARVRPPARNLVPWVRRVVTLAGRDPVAVAGQVAAKIWLKGIKPNPYIQEAVLENRDRIQETANRIGRAIAISLLKLPDIRLPD